MTSYAHTLTAHLRAVGHDAHCPWPTGGGCDQILVLAGDIEVGITDGDAALPDGHLHDEAPAHISARTVDGDEIAATTVAAGENITDAVTAFIQQLT